MAPTTSSRPVSANDATQPSPDSNINHAAAKAYWADVTPDVDGMLGGYPEVSKVDLQHSRAFLAMLGISRKRVVNSSTDNGSGSGTTGSEGLRKRRTGGGSGMSKSVDGAGTNQEDARIKPEPEVEPEADITDKRVHLAVDCGAGIGRITTGLLLSIAHTVDVVEPIKKFTDELQAQHLPGVGRIFNVGLEEWDPLDGEEKGNAEGKYDLIWNQWCLGHLTDEQLVGYLERCGRGLRSVEEAGDIEGKKKRKVTGIIVVKENITLSGKDMFDKVDNSVTRTDEKFRALFQKAGLKIKRTELQRGWNTSLFPVRMYALVPV